MENKRLTETTHFIHTHFSEAGDRIVDVYKAERITNTHIIIQSSKELVGTFTHEWRAEKFIKELKRS